MPPLFMNIVLNGSTIWPDFHTQNQRKFSGKYQRNIKNVPYYFFESNTCDAAIIKH